MRIARGAGAVLRASGPALPLAVAAVLFLRSAWIADDALISFHQVRVFVQGDGIVWNPGVRVQAFTHPLWFWVLSLAHWVTDALFWPAILLSLAASLGALLLLWRFARAQPWATAEPHWAAAVVLLPLLAPGFIDYSTSGLETALSYLLAAAALGLLLAREEDPPLAVLWLLLALLVLNRMDHALLFGPAALGLLWRTWAERRVFAMLPGVLLLVAWFGFAFLYFGSPLPNTYFAKAESGHPEHLLVENGLIYLFDAALRETMALPLILIGILAGLAGGAFGRLLALGLVAHLVYVVGIGGDFMRGRFLAVPVLVSVFLLVSALHRMRRSWVAAWLAGAALVFLTMEAKYRVDHPFAFNGIANEQAFYHADFGLLAPQRRWPEPSEGSFAVPRAEHVIFKCGLAGLYRFVAPPEVHVADICGLTDPFLARLPARQKEEIRAGHFDRRVPANYEAILSGKDTRLAGGIAQDVHDHVVLLTRAPLFEPRRLAALLSPLRPSDDVRSAYRHGIPDLVVGRGDQFPSDWQPFSAPGIGLKLEDLIDDARRPAETRD